jgi:hypothetical protein
LAIVYFKGLKMKVTVRHYKKMIQAMETPKNKAQLADESGLSDSGLHVHLNKLPKELISVVYDRKDGDHNFKHYYTLTRFVPDDEIIKIFKKININYSEADVQLDIDAYNKTKKKPTELFRDTGKEIKEQEYTVNKAITKTKTGYIVNGVNGYHSGKIERVRQKTYVGCTAEII